MSQVIKKVLILTDSAGAARGFPVSEVVELEETYPYLLREEYKQAVFYQLTFGNIVTEQLISQAIGYNARWNPDVIIVHSGMNDCRPESFTEFEKTIMNTLTGRLFGLIKKYVYHPALIKHRQVYRTKPENFRKTLKKLKMVFGKSKIFWLEICAGPNYEKERPGVNARMAQYNKIIEEVYGSGMVRVQEPLLACGGFNVDHLHWSTSGHRAVADLLVKNINQLAVSTREA